MKVPLSWLKEFIAFNENAQAIAETLTQLGIEVDAIDAVGNNLDLCCAVLVKSIKPHPEASKLVITTIFDGKQEHQIVCGAPNCREGMLTAWAQPGATIAQENQKILVSSREVRSVASYGVLCSEKELSIGEDHAGIIELSHDIQVGTPLKALYQDEILEVSLTPNLGHCLSILGIARELSCAWQRPYKIPLLELPKQRSSEEKKYSIQIKDKEKCLEYNLGYIKGIKVGPSPFWMKKRLQNAGIRSINNIVDCSNYVMLAYGIPTHVFDADSIKTGKITIRSDLSFTNFCTLDGKARALPEGTLMICDDENPLAIAGIMGGQTSAVNENTRNVLIEAALFQPQAIRASMKALHLRSESSNRFEKGVDPASIYSGLVQLMCLIQQCAGGEIHLMVQQETAKKIDSKTISLKGKNVNRILGTNLTTSEIASILQRLEMHVTFLEDNVLEVQIPSYRHDICKEIDLVEEVARVYGFNNLPISLALHTDSTLLHDPVFLLENKLRHILVGQNLQECIHCDLISPEQALDTAKPSFTEEELIHVLHPSALEQSTLRASLLPGFLSTARYNFDRGQKNLSLFEVGKIHYKDPHQFYEKGFIGILLSGDRFPYHYSPKPEKFDFYDLKGKIEIIANQLGIKELSFKKSSHPHYHPGRQAQVMAQNAKLGILGELHPLWLEKYGIEETVYFAELCLSELHNMGLAMSTMKAISPFPMIARDWTITVAKNIAVGTILESIKNLDLPYLESAHLLDIYAKEGREDHNLTFRFIYRGVDRTLKSEEVDIAQKQLEEKVTRRLLVK